MLLRDLAPAIPRIAMLVNPNGPTAERDVGAVEAAARAVGQQIDFLRASNERDIDSAFRAMVGRRQQHKPFDFELGLKNTHARHIAAWPAKACHKAE